MSNFTYQQIVDFLRESTGDNNWYLNNKIGQPVAHRYFQPLAVQRHVTEAVKKMKKMKDEEHAGDFAHKAKQSAAAGKTTFTIGGTTYPVKANPNVKEEVEQVDEGDTNFGHTVTRGSWVVHDGNKVKRFNTYNGAKAHAEKNGGKVASSEFYADKIQGKQGVAETKTSKNEEVEQVDEGGMPSSVIKSKQAREKMSPEDLHAHVKSLQAKGGPVFGGKSVEHIAREMAWSHGHGKMSPHYWDRIKHLEPKNEEVEQVDEVLNPSMGAEKYIHDFVHSDNPKFGGKSKKERIRMALGAYYHAKKNIQEYTEHTHAVHFENGKGEWEGMAFIHAKDDEDAKEQAHHMANSVKWAHLKMSHLEKHTPIVEEGVVSNEDELINVLAETFGLDEATKEQKLAARAARNARMAGNTSAARSKMSVKLQRRVGIAPEKSVASTKVSHQAKSVAAAKSASHPENHEETPLQKLKKINQARQDAHYAKGGGGGIYNGGGAKNSSPLERAMTAVKEKPVKGAGASPAELDAELKAKKKPVAEAYLSEKKMKKEELNTDMLDGHENDKSSKKKAKIVKKASKLKRKYMGKNKGRTATGEKAHVIETEVTLDDAKT